MIKLTQTNCKPLWVNPNYIAALVRGKDETYVYIGTDDDAFIVEETPETIIQKISAIK